MSAEARTLMVLGAGMYQVPGIRAAVARGLRVITADWDLRNPGHRHSHAQVEVSTTDLDGVLRAAQAEEIHGIVTFASDVATPTVAYVADAMNLSGPSSAAIQTLSNKARTRALQHRNGLTAPPFAVGGDVEELADATAGITGPIIVKPADSSGSRGVTQVERRDEATFHAAVQAARSFSRSRQVCVEAFVPGEEVGGDGILIDGRLAFSQCTHKHRRGFTVAGHSLPPDISPQEQTRVADAVAALCCAAGYREGVVNFDVIVDGDRTTVVELSPRTGGNGIPALLAAVCGVDTVQAAIAFALGEAPTIPPPGGGRHSRAGTAVLGAPTAGVIRPPRSEVEVRAAFPELIEFVCDVPDSGEVAAWDHGGASFGYCVFECPSGESYDDVAARARAAVGVTAKSRTLRNA